eukprot:Nitzschia sp. Nitz4//scaffold144_size56818//19572//22039//NITZ4_006532-RA/size56818-snap-gene-0.1-mRNA-1//1//CDS//3329536501//8844//frame0
MGLRSSETSRAFKSSLRRYLKCALRIASQEWATLGFEPIECPSPSIAANHSATSIEVTSELATSILLVRLLALRFSDEEFKGYTTAEVCNTLLGSSQLLEKVMVAVNLKAFTELRSFCRAILQGYNEVPYHNYLHAYHVLMSSNKLLDIVLQEGEPREFSDKLNSTGMNDLAFESNPLLHWSLVFGALIHDVDHLGVPNKQLVNENHPLAIQYNDQSVAEQRSLTVAFAELLKSEYDNLRQAVFPSGISQSSEYRKFRESVTSLILVTDISEPERGASVRQRWEKAFKDTETPQHGKFEDEMGSSAPKLAPPREHPTPRRQSKAISTTTVSQKGSFPKLPLRRNIEVDDPWVEFGLTPSTHFPRNCGSSMHDALGFWWFSPELPDDDSCESDSINSFSEEDSIYSDMSKDFISEMQVTRTPAEESEDSIQIFLSDDYPSMSLQDSCASFSSSNHCLLSPTPVRTMSAGTRSNSSSFSRLHRSTKSMSKVSLTNSSASKATPAKSYADLNDSFPNHASRSSVFSSPSRGSSKRHEGSYENERGKVDSDVSKAHRGKSTLGPLVSENSLVTVTTVDATTCSSFAKFDYSGCEFEESEGDLVVSTELHGKKPMDSVTSDTTKPQIVSTVDHAMRSLSLMEHILLVSDVSHGMQSWDNMIKFSHRLSKEIQRSITDGRSGGFSEDPLKDWYENQSAFLNGYMIPLAQRIERTNTLPSSSEHGESDRGFLTKLIHKNLDRWQEEGHEVIALWRRERDATGHADRPVHTSSRRKNSIKSPGKSGSHKKKSSRSHKSRGSVS